MRWQSSLRLVLLLAVLGISQACASVPMAPPEQDAASKEFNVPTGNNAGLYVYRNTFGGQALKKSVFLDGNLIGETANKVYFHCIIPAGVHTLATESEFGNNSLEFTADPAKLYFFQQYIKMGIFVGGSNLRAVNGEEGRKQVLKCKEALQASVSPPEP